MSADDLIVPAIKQGTFNAGAGARGIDLRAVSHRSCQSPTGYQVNRGRDSYRQAARAGHQFRRASNGAAPCLSAADR
jgi:hypothetical protein